MQHDFLLILLGLLIGFLGTLVGAGGGFILTPVLLILYPSDNPETITSIALAVTFANALSGSVAYGRMKRINYRYGLIFAAAAIPGAVGGALMTQFVPRKTFDLIFSVLLIVASVYIFLKPPEKDTSGDSVKVILSKRKTLVGILISFLVGIVASFLGIGGGIIHVPALAGLLDFPVHIATATSHFILVFVTFTAVVAHIVTGTFQHGLHRFIVLAVGVVIGAQVGARVSNRVRGTAIIRILAAFIFLVAVRLVLLYFRI